MIFIYFFDEVLQQNINQSETWIGGLKLSAKLYEKDISSDTFISAI